MLATIVYDSGYGHTGREPWRLPLLGTNFAPLSRRCEIAEGRHAEHHIHRRRTSISARCNLGWRRRELRSVFRERDEGRTVPLRR